MKMYNEYRSLKDHFDDFEMIIMALFSGKGEGTLGQARHDATSALKAIHRISGEILEEIKKLEGK